MVKVIGSEAASKGMMSPLDSVLRGARKVGIELAPPLPRQLERATTLREALSKIRKAEDFPIGFLPDAYPPDLLARLFGHQRVALAYFERSKLPAFLIADQPGVGKTAPAILWSSVRAKDILVIARGRARRQWGREIRRWSANNERVTRVRGTIPEQKRIISESRGWVVGHWEALVHARDAVVGRKWGAVILDEAHQMVNRKTKRAETAFEIDALYKLCLTGHPYVNSPDEIWSLLHFLYPEQYPSFWRFFSMHVDAAPGRFGGMEIIGPRQPKLLRWEISPFMLRRKKTQVRKTLPITREVRHVELAPKQRAEYRRLLKEFFVELEQNSNGEGRILPIFNVLARTTRVRQYLVDPEIIGSGSISPKYPAVLELLEELDAPPVIFTMFRSAAVKLKAYLEAEGYQVGTILGSSGSKAAERENYRSEKRFHRGKLDAIIVTIQAGGESLNLGRYGYIIFLDLPWTAKDYEQCEGRVDRPVEGTGESVPTTVYRLITLDTYEVKAEKRIERKKGMFDSVFDRRAVEKLFS